MRRKRDGVVLIDSPAGSGQFDRSILERMGHPVDTCQGPDGGALCPLLEGKGCAKFEQAHGVIFQLDLDRADHRAIVALYRQLATPDTPIRVLVRPDQVATYAELLRDVEVWTHEPTVAELDGFASQVEAGDRIA